MLDVALDWPGSDVELRLKSPDGNVIDRNNIPPGVTHELGKTYEALPSPMRKWANGRLRQSV